MPWRPCLRCGVLTHGSYCPTHTPSRVTPGRGSGTQIHRFRTAVMQAAGWQCQAIIDGRRCTEIVALQAHHVVPLREGGSNDASNGVALCGEHHRLIEHARHAA